MSRRRRGFNPAKVKADLAALEQNPPAQALQPRLDIRRGASVALLSLLSGALLLIAFAPFNLWWIAYFALVPWGLAVVGGRSARQSMLWAYLAGTGFWAIGLYWLTWITMAGYAPLVLYLGLYWLAAALLLRRAFGRRWPTWLSLPVIWVALEYARGFALSGFPWFYLAHSQHENTRLIQIADTTGQYGVSFFVAMVNGALIDILAQPLFVKTRGAARLTRLIGTATGVCIVAAVGLGSYGTYRLRQHTTRPALKVGIVQMAYPNSLFHPGADSQDIFDGHMNNTRPLVGQSCSLVVWPESMLAYPNMDPVYWAQFDADASQPSAPHLPLYTPQVKEIINTYQRNLRALGQLVRELNCPLLAGGGMPVSKSDPGERLSYNSALLYDRDGSGRLVLRDRYAKMHLVPFGEYVPFGDDWPTLHRWLRGFVPEEMPQLRPGERIVRFEVASWLAAPPAPQTASTSAPATRPAAPGVVRLVTPICYEGVFDRRCRSMIMQGGSKRADMIVNISNDGWFIWVGGSGRTHASTELDQHLVQYIFRAVECRVPVVRAVNTGISGYIDSNGRIQAVLKHDRQSKMVAGSMTVLPLADQRVSPYSLVGDLFAKAVCAVAVAGAVVLLWPRRGKPGKAGQS